MSVTPSDPSNGTESFTRSKSWAKETAAEILEVLRYGDPTKVNDTGHRWCANCFCQIREVEPPKPEEAFHNRWSGEISYSSDGMDVTKAELKYADSPETAKAAIGFATPTQHADHGEIAIDVSTRPDPIIRTGTICECGMTKHTQRERPIKSRGRAVSYAKNLSESINTLREEYQMGPTSNREEDRIEEWRHSRQVLTETVRALKKRPDMQDKSGQKPIFKAALAVALRRPDEY